MNVQSRRARRPTGGTHHHHRRRHRCRERKRTRRRQFKVRRPSMQHDFAITPSKIVLIDGPLVFNLPRASSTAGRRLALKRRAPRAGVVPREGDEGPFWVDTEETCFWRITSSTRTRRGTSRARRVQSRRDERVGHVRRVCRRAFDAGAVPSTPVERAATGRWRIDTKAKTLLSSRRMCEQTSDFPCINRQFTGLKYRRTRTARTQIRSSW